MIRALLALALSVSLPALAEADSTHWRGTVGRFSASVDQLGFDDGFGVGGWDAHDARVFAEWGQRISAVIPAGYAVLARRDVNDSFLQLVITSRDGRVDTLATQLADARSADSLRVILRRVQVHLSVPDARVPALRPARLYTIQLGAFADRERAFALAERVSVRIDPGFYQATCGPCFAQLPSVRPAHGVHRVVGGVYRSERAARHAIARLGADGRGAYVRRVD